MNAVFHAPSASAALQAAAGWIEPLLGKSEILVASATRAAGDEFVRSLAGPGSFGVHRYTLAQLAAALAGSQAAPATRLAMEAVAARVTHEVYKSGRLAYFAPVAKFPGFPSALTSTLHDLRLARIGPAELTGSPAALDIGLLLEAYERELATRQLADLAALLERATAHARAGGAYSGLPLLVLDVPLPSQAHVEFMEALVSRAAAVCATVVSADTERVREWERILAEEAAGCPPDPGPALEQLREQLFAAEPPAPADYDESVDLFSSPGESLESVEIARRIARMQGPFDRVAILLRHPERYQPLIEEALRRAGIPAYFSRGTARPDPAGRAFLALLACASEGCSASRFAEYMSLGQLPSLDESGAPPKRPVIWAAPEDELLTMMDAGGAAIAQASAPTTVATPLAWEKLLVDAAVIGGYERWTRRLQGLENEFRIQLDSLETEEQAERQRLERELERLGNLERFALPLIEDLHALPSQAPWSQWLEALSRLAARALANTEPVLAVLSELRPMSDVGPVDLDEVYGVLSTRMRMLRREPPHRRYGRVFVGSIEEARGRTFDIVFLPGVAEGLFPRRAMEDPLLLDDVRRRISPSLATNQDRVADERLLLHTAVAGAGTRFIASYPSMDPAQGRPRVPSFYALEIARAIEGRVPALRSFETRLSTNAEARLLWPAPADPSHSVDDAEYDLAWLAAHRAERGGARYLLDANAHLGRSLRTRWKRWERKWTDADGFVQPDQATQTLLAQQRPSARAYSPSALQHFAACPYRFALNAILHLKERQEPAAIEQLDPLTRGALVHEVQRDFLREWKLQPSTVEAELFQRLDDVLQRVSRQYAEKIAPAIPRVWDSELEDVRTDLRGWLSIWLTQVTEWEPLFFELGFGLGNKDRGAHDAASSPEPLEAAGIRIRGSIDLVERHRQRGTLRITDHKTGRAPDRGPTYIDGGKVLQPLLYALAAERMFDAKTESGRLFYCTQRGAYSECGIDITDSARRYFAGAMALIDGAVSNGFLPAAPAEKTCALCEYSPVCGPHEEVRVKKWKDPEALVELNQLRSLP